MIRFKTKESHTFFFRTESSLKLYETFTYTKKNQQNKPTDQGILKKPFRSIQHCLPQVCLKKKEPEASSYS